MKIIKIKELNIEIEEEIHHKDKKYVECEKDCPTGWEIATYEVLQKLRNDDKYREKLGLMNTWEFVQNPDEISKKNGYVAWFDSYSNGVVLNCYRLPDGSNSALGVRYMRRLKRRLKK